MPLVLLFTFPVAVLFIIKIFKYKGKFLSSRRIVSLFLCVIFIALLVVFANISKYNARSDAYAKMAAIEDTFPLIRNELEILRLGEFNSLEAVINWYEFDEFFDRYDLPQVEIDALQYILFADTLPLNPVQIRFADKYLDNSSHNLIFNGAYFENESRNVMTALYYCGDFIPEPGIYGVLAVTELTDGYWIVMQKENVG